MNICRPFYFLTFSIHNVVDHHCVNYNNHHGVDHGIDHGVDHSVKHGVDHGVDHSVYHGVDNGTHTQTDIHTQTHTVRHKHTDRQKDTNTHTHTSPQAGLLPAKKMIWQPMISSKGSAKSTRSQVCHHLTAYIDETTVSDATPFVACISEAEF